MPPFVIAVAGGTASGKTTLVDRFAASEPCLRVTHDRYYHDVAEPRGHDYDHPDALESEVASWVNTRVETVAGADHFLVGRTDVVERLGVEFVEQL